MAMSSTCPKPGCNNHSFEIAQYTPRDSPFKLNFVQCTSCGSVVGVLEYFNIGTLLHKLATKLRVDLDR